MMNLDTMTTIVEELNAMWHMNPPTPNYHYIDYNDIRLYLDIVPDGQPEPEPVEEWTLYFRDDKGYAHPVHVDKAGYVYYIEEESLAYLDDVDDFQDVEDVEDIDV